MKTSPRSFLTLSALLVAAAILCGARGHRVEDEAAGARPIRLAHHLASLRDAFPR